MALSAITNHVERGLSRLIDQFKDKPRLESWISSYLEEVQELSDAAWQVLVTRLIDDAEAEQLTTLGRLVGQTRTIDDDDRFRVLVRARIAVNQSRGRWDDILRIANLLLGDTEYTLTAHFPKALVLTIEEPIDFIPTLEQSMLSEAVSAGERIDVHFHADDSDELFRLGEGPGWGEGLWAGAVSDHTI
ncbi:MAG TPA: hypothetical protein VM493_07750 [Vicinamibacterales bacterium]|jgi:hypothetical protein|nr:hypothetical protein [Vicinamibacterales bacterium]